MNYGVVLTMNEKVKIEKFGFTYKVEEEIYNDEILGKYLSHGINLIEDNEEKRIIKSINDISLDKGFVENVAYLFNYYQLDPIHFEEAIDDFLS